MLFSLHQVKISEFLPEDVRNFYGLVYILTFILIIIKQPIQSNTDWVRLATYIPCFDRFVNSDC